VTSPRKGHFILGKLVNGLAQKLITSEYILTNSKNLKGK